MLKLIFLKPKLTLLAQVVESDCIFMYMEFRQPS